MIWFFSDNVLYHIHQKYSSHTHAKSNRFSSNFHRLRRHSRTFPKCILYTCCNTCPCNRDHMHHCMGRHVILLIGCAGAVIDIGLTSGVFNAGMFKAMLVLALAQLAVLIWTASWNTNFLCWQSIGDSRPSTLSLFLMLGTSICVAPRLRKIWNDHEELRMSKTSSLFLLNFIIWWCTIYYVW